MTTLLLDIGNTRIKWATYNKEGLHFEGENNVSEEILHSIFEKKYDMVLVSNVAGESVNRMISSCASQNQTIIFLTSEKESPFGVKNGYAIPTQLGVDRWLALQAAWQRYASSCCIISCGTAITIDYIDNSSQHLGGFIYPGLSMMRKALHAGTAALPYVTENISLSSKQLANNTVDAIARGTVLGITDFINAQLLRYQTEHSILTGGDADTILPLLTGNVEIDPLLVLKGAALYVSR